jgi:predicted aminopeptidase
MMGCQIAYLVGSAYDQTGLLMSRVSIEKVLKDPNVDAEKKRKLKLTIEVHQFAESIGLKQTKSYTSYVQLDRPYVTYVVSAAEKNKLSHYLWSFPFVGELPYKGYFKKDKALELAKEMKDKNYDVFVRGVSAYSTLGWFYDPVLSSMLSYSDYDLVNTLHHEMFHATVFLKNANDMNERLANFIGTQAAIEFYKKHEGSSSETVVKIEQEVHDDRIFSQFITKEIKDLDEWYKERAKTVIPEEIRQARLKQIQTKFLTEVRPLIDKNFRKDFELNELNNAKLLLFKLYDDDPAELEQLYGSYNKNLIEFIAYLKTLKSQEELAAKLSELRKSQKQ